jgi:urease accessory protein
MPQEVRGCARLRFASAPQGQVVDLVYCQDPLRLFFNRPEPGQPATAVVVTTSGGLLGGDRLELAVELGPGTRALLTSQAAEKVHRSAGADSQVEIALTVRDRARLEWLPQETILFEGARLRRQLSLDLWDGAEALAGEMLVFGRAARGEAFTRGMVRDAWQVRRDGRLLWADALRLEGELDGGLARALQHPAGLGGARACATALYAAPAAGAALDLVRQCLGEPEGVRAAATAFPGLVVARLLGDDAHVLRRAFSAFWGELRSRLWGLPSWLPRVWHL